jgi:hypothetical protein
MKRAAILIGVDKTGDLPKLKDAARGARLMETWARSQGIDTVTITDEAEPVTVERIKKAVRQLVDAANVSQLVVYFAGHGVNLQRQEYWLLTEAPDDSQAAVNVATSAALAATCGIAHVVLISDACRTAPEGVRAQSMRGSEIFPNREEDTRPVDQFFACQLGKPSHEVKDPAVTSAEFKALYTHELVPALLGQRRQIVEWSADGSDKSGYVHLRPLRDHLSEAVAAKIVDLDMQTKVMQVPVAQISSDPPAWISRIAQPSAADVILSAPQPRQSRARSERAGSPEAVTADLLRTAMGLGAPAQRVPPAAGSRGHGGGPVDEMLSASRDLARPFGPTHHETGCGFKLRGNRVVEVLAPAVKVEFAGGGQEVGDDLRVVDAKRPGANVLLVLQGGSGVLLPAIPDFLCALSFDEGELVDVAYEPSDNTWRWGVFHSRAQELRGLRAVASSAMARGTFKLEGDDALAIAQRMQLAKGVDPSLAVYAAYAYHELQRKDLLHQMASYLQGDLGAALFDVALLARAMDKRAPGAGLPVLGAVPMLSQGWPLLRAFEVRLPSALAALEGMRLPSLWTMFDVRGVAQIRKAFSKGDLQ